MPAELRVRAPLPKVSCWCRDGGGGCRVRGWERAGEDSVLESWWPLPRMKCSEGKGRRGWKGVGRWAPLPRDVETSGAPSGWVKWEIALLPMLRDHFAAEGTGVA